jgi:hypothetical protein
MADSSVWDVESSFNVELPDASSVRGSSASAEMPDIYASEYVAKKTDPEIVDQSLPNIDKFVGFNPYDTGVLQKK